MDCTQASFGTAVQIISAHDVGNININFNVQFKKKKKNYTNMFPINMSCLDLVCGENKQLTF